MEIEDKKSQDISSNGNLSSTFIRGKRLKILRQMADLSRKEVEQKYHISENTQRSWEEGKHTGLTEQGARRILIALRNEGIRCSIGWLLYGTGSSPQLSENFIKPEIKRNSLSEDIIDISNLDQELTLLFNRHDNIMSMIVEDDGMDPLFKRNDYIAGIKYFGEKIFNLIGQYCIVETEMGEKYARLLRKGSQSGYYTLVCINPHTTFSYPAMYDIELVSAAIITWHRIKEFK